MYDGIGVVFNAVAGYVGPIELEAGFGWQNQKLIGVSSILVRYIQIQARMREGVCAIGLV